LRQLIPAIPAAAAFSALEAAATKNSTAAMMHNHRRDTMNLKWTIKMVSSAIGAGAIAAAVLLTGLGDHVGPSSDQVTLADNTDPITLKPFPTEPLPTITLKPFPTQAPKPSAPRGGRAGGAGLPVAPFP
jgi:hypothetical protein